MSFLKILCLPLCLTVVVTFTLFSPVSSRAEQPHIFDLITQLGAAQWEERSAAAIALGKRQDKAALVPLSEALRDDSKWVRVSAASALGEFQDPDGVEALLGAVKDEDAKVRVAAIQALGKINDPAAVETLIEALRDEEAEVRLSVVHVLGVIRDPRAVTPLVGAMNDRDAKVRKLASATLKLFNQNGGDKVLDQRQSREAIGNYVADKIRRAMEK